MILTWEECMMLIALVYNNMYSVTGPCIDRPRYSINPTGHSMAHFTWIFLVFWNYASQDG